MKVQTRNGSRSIPNGYKDVPDEKVKFVGGYDGVFACWEEGDFIVMAAGDDGSWWEIAKYSKFWGPGIAQAITDATGAPNGAA